MKVKEESENVGLKVNIQKMKIMASGPITSWEIDEEIHSPQIHVLDKSPWSYKKCQLLIRVPGLEPLPSIPTMF